MTSLQGGTGGWSLVGFDVTDDGLSWVADHADAARSAAERIAREKGCDCAEWTIDISIDREVRSDNDEPLTVTAPANANQESTDAAWLINMRGKAGRDYIAKVALPHVQSVVLQEFKKHGHKAGLWDNVVGNDCDKGKMYEPCDGTVTRKRNVKLTVISSLLGI